MIKHFEFLFSNLFIEKLRSTNNKIIFETREQPLLKKQIGFFDKSQIGVVNVPILNQNEAHEFIRKRISEKVQNTLTYFKDLGSFYEALEKNLESDLAKSLISRDNINFTPLLLKQLLLISTTTPAIEGTLLIDELLPGRGRV